MIRKILLFIKRNFKIVISFFIGAGCTFLFILGHNLFPENSVIDFQALLIAFGVIIALGGVIWSTNKQIRNQNKERNKPYLVVSKIQGDDSIITDNMVVNFKLKIDESTMERDIIYNYVKISNQGYGIGSNIWLTGVNFHKKDVKPSQKISIEYLDYTSKTHMFSIISTAQEKVLRIGILPTQQDEHYMIPIYILMFYSDLNYNTYSLLFKIEKVSEGSATTFESYNANTAIFETIMEEIKCDYEDFKNKYFEKIRSRYQND